MSKSSPSIKEKSSPAFQQRDEEEGDLEQTDDITDDSASSYYTALCSLSEYSEAPEDRTHTERPTEGDSYELLDCSTSVASITSRSVIKDYKCTEVLPEVSQCEQDSLVLESESKHLLPSTTITNVDSQSIKANPIQNQDNSNGLNISGKDSSVKSRDYFGGSSTVFHTNIRSAEEHSSPEPGFNSNTILITPDRNQYREQERGGTEPEENHATQKLRPREGLSTPRLEKGGHILGHVLKDGEGLGRVVSCKKEQTELSVRSRNRKASANSISTLTANKQESRIPPHCYSERIPATRHQHQLQTLADTRRLEKQSRQGVWQSRPLSRTLSSRSCQPCHTRDNTSGSTSMGTKLAEASSELGGFVNLAQVRSSCSETNYMHVFGSSCRPSSQLPSDGNHDKWTEDVLAFKMQICSKTHNTSAGSESSSFECVDVALETTDEVNRGLKTVPKRQIQLKRRDAAEGQVRENNNQSHQIPNTPVRPRDIFQRQHSTPAALTQESPVADQRSVQAERKQRLQKSYSLDETSCKTQMASSIITNVLSKKMQHEQNLRTLDVSDKAFASTKVNIRNTNDECLYSSGKDVYAETTKLYQSATLKRDAQAESSSTQKQYNSKTQPKLLSKHGFSTVLSGTNRSEVQGSGTEITDPSENEKAEKLSSREEALQLPNLSPGVKLSCDSAKGRTWNSSAATNVAISSQASVKTTPEECHTGQGIQAQHNMTRTNVLEKQEQQAGSMESTLSPTNIACLISDLEANAVDNTTPNADGSSAGKEQEIDTEDIKSPGQFASIATQNQGKLKAPVHIVRDMRSLVKNTYNMPFKGPGECTHGIDGSTPLFQPSIHNLSNKSEAKGKGYRQDERPLLRKVTPPLPLDRRRDHSAPRGCSAKVMPPVESNDKSHTIGFTKVSPISVTKANSCALSKPSETQDSQVGKGKPDVQVTDPYLKPTNRTDLALQPREKVSTDMPTKGECEMTISPDKDQLFPALQYCLPSSQQQDQGKIISDGLQTPCPPPRSQSSVGPLSACVLTVASTPVVPSYYYKPNLLGYQTISPHIGAVHGYVQGPVLFQTPLYNQSPASNSHTPIMRSLSEDGKTLVQPTDGSTSQTQNEDPGLKIPSPESQHNTIFVAPISAEARLGGAGVMYPEAGGSVAAGQIPRQLLLDPETGRYFYVDMPQLPQRKMLFDPETCQYVEVLLPQQTLPCAIPFASLHIPPMYSPQCFPYIQSHHQVLPPQGP